MATRMAIARRRAQFDRMNVTHRFRRRTAASIGDYHTANWSRETRAEDCAFFVRGSRLSEEGLHGPRGISSAARTLYRAYRLSVFMMDCTSPRSGACGASLRKV